MNRVPFIVIFIVTNLFFMFALIYKNSLIVGLTYEKQKNENERNGLLKKRDALKQDLCIVQNRATIKEYATSALCMQQINFNTIKKLPAASS